MKVVYIIWDINMQDVCNKMDSLPPAEAAKILGITEEKYTQLSGDERDNYTERAFALALRKKNEFMGLPYEADVPDDIPRGAITSWLTEKYGRNGAPRPYGGNYICHSCFEPIPGEDDFFEKPNNLPLDKLVEKVGTKIII